MQTRSKLVFSKLILFSILVGFLVVGLSTVPVSAQGGSEQWLAFGPETEGNLPEVELLSASGTSIEIQATMPGAKLGETTIAGQNYLTLTGEGYTFNGPEGAPSLPVLRRMIEVPLGAQVSLELLKADSQIVSLAHLGLGAQIAPIQPSQPKCGDPIEPCSPSAPIYGGGYYPAEYLSITDDYIIRGHRIVIVEIRPVRYNASLAELETTSEMTFRLNLAGSDMALTISEADRLNSQPFNEMLQPMVLNYNQSRPVAIPNDSQHILIITADTFEAGLAGFVSLKQSQGFTVSVANLTTAGGNTTTAIKNYIKAQYTGANPPDYAILVGDYISGNPAGSLTNYSMRTSSSYRTDLQYFTMDNETEFYPDIFYGRFPVRTDADLSAMVDKYVTYHNRAGDEPWVKKATFLGSNDSSYGYIAERTHNYVIETYTLPKGYSGIFPNNPQPGGDKVYEITYDLGGPEANAAMNDNRAFVVYSGHGATTFWDAPRVDQNNVRNMTGVAIPYVASHACITADFNTGEAFSDTWVIEPVNGALTFFGASQSSYWYEDEVLEKAIFDFLYADPTLDSVPSVAAMTQFGLQAVENYGTSRDDYYREMYHVFGDPSLEIIMKPKFPDFRLSVSPTALKTCNIGANTALVNLTTINDFTGPVTLTASELEGYTTSFATNPVLPPGSTTATITGDGTVETGVQTLTITGTSGSLVHSADVEMTIYKPITSAGPRLTSPADGARDVAQRPAFSWTGVADAESYQLQVALDRDFTHIAIDRSGITGTNFTLSANLASDTQYYWRVFAENVCGKVESTDTFTFRTKPGPGDCAQGTVKQIVFFDDFEDGLGAWQNPLSGLFKFDLTTVRAYSPTHSVVAVVPEAQTDQRFESPAFAVPQTIEPVSMIFWHRWTFDSPKDCNDGAILEVTLDGGTTWNQVGKPYLLTNPYNGIVKTGAYNPLVGKQAWCQNENEWVRTVVDLNPFKGKTVQFRFRLGTGTLGAAEGWYIDDVSFQTCVEADFSFQMFIPAVEKH
ncbi:MAG: C25 family cysteine peptidase [Anaerolineaceae bacterium]|nr:C25 family cysteine peptidase [Anaerolineaceae bacterium]MDD4577667.1 C25 family cysteine peptidase [Anaerolineaceae bacterium]